MKQMNNDLISNLKRGAALLFATAVLYTAIPTNISPVYAQENQQRVNQQTEQQSDEVPLAEFFEHIEDMPFAKQEYNIAMILDDAQDSMKVRPAIEREMGNFYKYPYTIIRQETMDQELRKRGIDKARFMQNPLKYEAELKSMNLDGIVLWGYCKAKPTISIPELDNKASYTKFSFKYYDFTHDKIVKQSEHFPPSLTVGGFTKQMAYEIGLNIKVFERYMGG